MIGTNFSIFSAFILGALHALEPGHGKSIVALHTVQSRKISEAFSILASLILSHFAIILILSYIIYLKADQIDLHYIQLVAPVLVIFYGLFLLVKSRKNSDEYLACSCSHDVPAESKRNPIMMGMIAGLTPCPSVFAPIVLAISSHQIDKIFIYLLSYILGVIFLFLVLTIGLFIIRDKAKGIMETLVSKVNPHLVSGLLLLIIGCFYLAVGVLGHH